MVVLARNGDDIVVLIAVVSESPADDNCLLSRVGEKMGDNERRPPIKFEFDEFFRSVGAETTNFRCAQNRMYSYVQNLLRTTLHQGLGTR